MGIPHLITFLRPYAESQSLAGHDVIVDGPGLCYHIHFKCLSRRAEARNSLEAAPSYKQLGDAVIEWLEGLRSGGAIVRKIYFDGFLPPAKLKTRLQRLEKQTKQLTEYYNIHSVPCRALSSDLTDIPQSIFHNHSPRPALTSLSPPSFLVPAILEALKNSKDYKDLSEIVPGEADLYCAKYAKMHGEVVLTGDSDLLVHSLGDNGAVVFFSDVELFIDEQSCHLHARTFQSAAIAQRLGLPKPHGLLSLAFEMYMDNHDTFPSLVTKAISLQAIKSFESMYKDFCREYESVEEGGVSASTAFQLLDPRISEVVLQFPSLAQIAGQHPVASTQDNLHMFLPFLLDCPVRTSAWEISTSVRQLAYGLLNLIVTKAEQHLTITEHRRQQKNAPGREWQLPSVLEIPGACMAIVKRLTQLEEKLPKSDIWLAAMLCQDLEWSSSLDKAPLSQVVLEELRNLEDPTESKSCTWDCLHLLAQIQGSYYSFRILKQISGLVLAQQDTHSIPKAIVQLNERLQYLPGFDEIPDLGHMTSLHKRIEKLSTTCREILGMESLPLIAKDETSTKSSRKKRKRKSSVADSSTLPKNKNRSSNPFELLEEE